MDIKNHLKIATSALSVLAAGALIQSCKVDERYSYDKIEKVNTDVTLFEDGLSVPLIESTCKISVDSILSLSGISESDFNDYLKTDDEGGYYLYYKEDYSFTDAVDAMDLSNVLNISPITCTKKMTCSLNVPASGIPEGAAGSVTLDEISITLDESVDVKILDAADIPDMVKGIGVINLDGTTMELAISLDNLPDIGDGEYTVTLDAELPSFIKPSSITLDGALENGKISKVIKVEGLDFSAEDIEQLRKDKSGIEGQVAVKGTVKAENPTLNIADIKNSISGEVSVHVSGENDVIKVKDIRAKIDYQTNKEIVIPFFDLSETIDDFNLDLPEATVTAEVSSNLAIPMAASIDLNEGMYDLSLAFPYSEDPSQSSSKVNEYSLDLNPVIRSGKEKMPAAFSIAVSPEQESIICPEADYSMDVNFSFRVPVQLGEEFYITYADTVALEDNADLIRTLMEQTAVTLSGTADNTLPFGVNVTMEFLRHDATADTYSLIDIGTDNPVTTIAAGEKGSFKFSLEASPAADLTGLSHVRFSFRLGANGALLNRDNYIQFTKMSLNAPKGVSLDISDIINGEDE